MYFETYCGYNQSLHERHKFAGPIRSSFGAESDEKRGELTVEPTVKPTV